MPATLVVVTGPPGTGKSTVAEAAAGALGAAVLGWDGAMAGLTGFAEVQAAPAGLTRERHRAVGWSILGEPAPDPNSGRIRSVTDRICPMFGGPAALRGGGTSPAG